MFLADTSHTFASREQDYFDWHQGRSYFSLWYLEIKSQALEKYLEQLQQQCADFLYFPNHRQWHITLSICGFWNVPFAKQHLPDDFSFQQLQQQLAILKCAEKQPIKLKLAKLNSFYSALFVEVIDVDHQLDMYRLQLQQHCFMDKESKYYPHITLGLYRDEFPAQQVLQHIESIETQPFEFLVDQLTFGYYQTDKLQGALTAQYQIGLG